MRNPLIDQYIEKYYAKWEKEAYFTALALGIPEEAHEILMDVMESVLLKPVDKLLTMIERDRQGNRFFYNYVKKAIRLQTYQYKHKRWMSFCCVNPCLPDDPGCDDITLDFEPQIRELEARFRDDHFFDPRQSLKQAEKITPMCNVYPVSPVACTTAGNLFARVGFRVEYTAAESPKRKRKNFKHRGEAVQWVMQNSI